MNTSKFNLEEAKQGKPVITVGGYEVRIVCFDCKSPNDETPLLALIKFHPDTETPLWLDSNGRYDHNPDHRLTVVMTTKEVEL